MEWVIAGALTLLTFTAGAVVVRELRTVGAVMPVSARESTPPASPLGVPSRAVSVPVLFLADGKAVRVGETASEIAAHLGRQAEVGSQWVESTPLGDRLTRLYEHQGARFVLVFEAFKSSREPRVAGIYLH
jgi:hypothetical protein